MDSTNDSPALFPEVAAAADAANLAAADPATPAVGTENSSAGESPRAQPRLERAQRGQALLLPMEFDDLIPADHDARIVWDFVVGLDLSELYDRIRSVPHHPGRAAIDPRLLLALWLFATIDGEGSARKVARLCEEHNAYRWLCGGVTVNYHTLSDFRTAHVELLDRLLTHSVATLHEQGLIDLDRVSQDGLRVRADAGAASFRRRPTLEEALRVAEERVRTLRDELDHAPGSASKRQQAAQKRAARERQERVQEALKQLAELEGKERKSKSEPRVSTTDPDARVMKMADGGFRPAFNMQFASTTATQVIVGVEVINNAGDNGQLAPMRDQIEERYETTPKEMLVDGGFSKKEDIETVAEQGTTVYTPVQKAKKPGQDPHEPRATDSPIIAAWRQRMATPEAKEIYKQRSMAELVNAFARRFGLTRVWVRGLDKVRTVGLWFALAFNLMTGHRLRAEAAARVAEAAEA